MLHSLVRVSRRVGRGRPNTSSTGAQVTLSATRSSATTLALHAVHTARFTRCREAPPFGVHHHGQGLPSFLGRTGSAGRQGCKLSMRDRPASTHLPLPPCGSGPAAAGPCSRGVRRCLGRTARNDLRRRVGTFGGA